MTALLHFIVVAAIVAVAVIVDIVAIGRIYEKEKHTR